jgi:hypothetical protein
MNELTMNGDKRMTVKEVAEALGTAESTIRNKAAELFPEYVKNGIATMLTEKQVVAIKASILPRDLTLKSKLDSAVTELEMRHKAAEVIAWLTGQVDKEREGRLAAEGRVNRLVHNNRTYTTTEIAKELGFKSAQAMNEDLHERGIQFKDTRGVWVLYSEYAGRGFQNIKQKEVNGAPRYYSEWTGIGRDWLNGLYWNDSGII